MSIYIWPLMLIVTAIVINCVVDYCQYKLLWKSVGAPSAVIYIVTSTLQTLSIYCGLLWLTYTLNLFGLQDFLRL